MQDAAERIEAIPMQTCFPGGQQAFLRLPELLLYGSHDIISSAAEVCDPAALPFAFCWSLLAVVVAFSLCCSDAICGAQYCLLQWVKLCV